MAFALSGGSGVAKPAVVLQHLLKPLGCPLITQVELLLLEALGETFPQDSTCWLISKICTQGGEDHCGSWTEQEPSKPGEHQSAENLR